MKALILSADNFEDQELFYPLNRLKEEGIIVKVASIKQGIITGEYGYSINVDMTFNEVDPKDFDILILPGGKAPEKVRLRKKCPNEIAQHFFRENKLVGVICHGGQNAYFSRSNRRKESDMLHRYQGRHKMRRCPV